MAPILERNLLSSEDASAIFSDLELLIYFNHPLLKELEEKMHQWPHNTVGILKKISNLRDWRYFCECCAFDEDIYEIYIEL
jgi:hypothetical protein